MPFSSSRKRIWDRVNKAIMGENAGEVIATLIDGMTAILVTGGVVDSADQGRAHLAAMILSPANGKPAGSLLPLLDAEIQRLKGS